MAAALAIIGMLALLIVASELALHIQRRRDRARALLLARLNQASGAPEGPGAAVDSFSTPWGIAILPRGRLINPVAQLRRKGLL